jgi:hypothetical protein
MKKSISGRDGNDFVTFLKNKIMRKLLFAGMLLLFLSACGSGDNGSDREGDTTNIGGGDPSSGSGGGGNTNNIGTDTMRGISTDTSRSDTLRDTIRN